MNGKNENKIAFYAETDDGLCDEIIIDMLEEQYEYNSQIDKRELECQSDVGLKEFLIDRAAFTAVYELADKIYSGSYFIADNSYDERMAEEAQYERRYANRPMLPKAKIWQAIRWELEENEINSVCSYEKFAYESDDYYDFDLILDKVHAFMSGEKSVNYFTAWCIVMMRCLYAGTSGINADIQYEYDEISDWLDCLAFLSSGNSKEEQLNQCKEFIADLKWRNHRITDIRRGKNTDFEKNGVVIYIAFAFSLNDGRDVMYRVCVADKKKRTVNYYYAQNIIMEEKYNYTFVKQAEFNWLSSKYYEFKHDPALNMDSQLKKHR